RAASLQRPAPPAKGAQSINSCRDRQPMLRAGDQPRMISIGSTFPDRQARDKLVGALIPAIASALLDAGRTVGGQCQSYRLRQILIERADAPSRAAANAFALLA